MGLENAGYKRRGRALALRSSYQDALEALVGSPPSFQQGSRSLERPPFGCLLSGRKDFEVRQAVEPRSGLEVAVVRTHSAGKPRRTISSAIRTARTEGWTSWTR